MVLSRNRIIAGGMTAVAAVALAAGLWFQQSAVVAVAIVMAAAVYALLILATLRRAGYLIVVARQNQEQVLTSISAVTHEQSRLVEILQRAALHDFRELFLSAFREVNEAVETLSAESKKSLGGQAHVEELVGRIDAITSSIDARVSGLSKRLEDLEYRVGNRLHGIEDHAASMLAAVNEGIAKAADTEQSLDSAMVAGFAVLHERTAVLSSLDARVAMMDKHIERVAQPITKMVGAIDRGDLRYPLLNDIASMSRLISRFNPRAAVPRMSGWGMDANTLERIIELILSKRPRFLVECGSGSSSVWLAYAAREAGARMVSLEHLDAYARETRAELERQGLAAVAEVRLAPLKEVALGDTSFNWYDPDRLGDLDGLDFLIVDGPPKAVGEDARFPALPVLHSKLAAQGIVLFDDAHRKDEARILELWREAYPELGSPTAIGDRTVVMDWQRT
jgi:hypothetical protein